MKNTIILMVDGAGIKVSADLNHDTYEVKGTLKAQGFTYADGKWFKHVTVATREELIEMQAKGGKRAVADKVVEAKKIYDAIIAECPLKLEETIDANALVNHIVNAAK